MSTSPAHPAPASKSGAPPAPAPRKKAPVSIFNNKKKPVRRPQQPQVSRPAAIQQQPNGATARPNQTPVQPAINGAAPQPPTEDDDAGYIDYPILITRNALNRGLHYHAMRFHSHTTINPYDEKQFIRPLRLHRRYAGEKLDNADHSDAASGVDDKERESMAARRAEREAEREANKAMIAPTGDALKKPAKRKQQKKVEDVYYDENNPKHKARSQLRYEEARSWHLEDDDAKNAWVGSYEQPLSESSVMFVVEGSSFTMIPVEKWYKMQNANRVDLKLDSETIEKHMTATYKPPRWFLKTQTKNDATRAEAANGARINQQAAVRRRTSDEETPAVKNEDYEYRADVDEIDFEYNDEFQDDDEGFVFGEAGDDETKEVEKKIRLERREANLAGTGVKNEDKDWDEEEQEEKKTELERKQTEKRMRKQLRKKEARQEYASDESDVNKYESSSESEDSDEERERVEDERKLEEARKANDDKSDSSSRGTNTPSGRREKRANANGKRDADLSEMSGNESSRKKAKLNGRTVSPSALKTARSLSPDTAKPRRPTRSNAGDAGSGSDTDTSRAGRVIKLKNSPSKPGSPTEKRSAANSRSGSPTGSRASSPSRRTAAAGTAKKSAPTNPAAGSASVPALLFPTRDDLRATIPPEGIELPKLVEMFKTHVAGRSKEFIALVKQVCQHDPVTKRLMPRALG